MMFEQCRQDYVQETIPQGLAVHFQRWGFQIETNHRWLSGSHEGLVGIPAIREQNRERPCVEFASCPIPDGGVRVKLLARLKR